MSLENQETSQPIGSDKSLLVGNRLIRSGTFNKWTLVIDEENCPETIFLDTPLHHRYIGAANSPIYATYQPTKEDTNEGPVRDVVPTPEIYFKYNFKRDNSTTHVHSFPDTLDKVCTDIQLAANYNMDPALQSLFEKGLFDYPADIEGDCVVISSKQLTSKGISGLRIKIGNNTLVCKTSSTPGLFFNIKDKTIGIIYNLDDGRTGIVAFPLFNIEEWYFLQSNEQE